MTPLARHYFRPRRAKRFPPYGMGKNGHFVHCSKMLWVRWAWNGENWTSPFLRIDWACGAQSTRPVLFPDLHEDDIYCQGCFPNGNRDGWGRKHSLVYYAEHGGAIKIGCSIDPVKRCQTSHWKLLATEPGSYNLELARHQEFGDALIDGEWFYPGRDLMSHIERLQRQAA